LFTQIAAQFAGFGKGERAIEIAHSIEDEEQQVQALTQVAAILASRNEDEQSRQAVNAIHEDSSRVFALISMSDSKAKNDHREAAVSLLDEAVHLAETVSQLSLRPVAYNEAIKRYFELGEKDKASASSALSLRTIAAIRDESRRATCLVDLAVIQATSGFELAESDVPVLRTILRAS
jgi:hypothetical protein